MKSDRLFRLAFLVGMVSLLGLAGCGEEEVPVDELLVEGCEHMAEGPASAVTATASAEGAPDVSAEHTRFDISLVAVTGGQGGSVAYASAEASDYVFFLSEDVAVAVADASGGAVEVEAKEAVTACDEVAVQVTVPLGVGTYTLSFGPTEQTSVSLVAEASSLEHTEEE